jgi:hypothetical protein
MKYLKSALFLFIVPIFFLLILSLPVVASDQQKAMDHSGHIGKKIHESVVQGYRLAYHLLDLPGREAKHLITYIRDAQGHAVINAQVGYQVVAPDSTKKNVMAMVMDKAYGADVNLTAKGTYTIKAKAAFKDKKLLDQFTFIKE